MTALGTTGAPAAPAARPRPSATSGLVRTVFRLHRPALLAGAAFLVVVAAVLLWMYGPLTDAAAAAWRQYNRCQWATCGYDQDAITTYKSVYNYATFAVVVVPALVAAWAGASLIGREMESGTAALTWTQSVTPVRWLTVKLAVPAAFVVAGTSLLAVLHRLMWNRGEGRIDTAKPWTDAMTFQANGPLTVAFALFGLVAGALAGLALRRSLGALVLGLVWAAAGGSAVGMALPHLWPTVRTVTPLTHDGPRSLGLTVHEGLLTAGGDTLANPYCGSSRLSQCSALYKKLDAVSYYTDSHPYAHFWPLQLVTSALVLVLTALLALVAFRLLKRRTATVVKGNAL